MYDELMKRFSATLSVNMRYRMLGADRRIFRVTFIKALLTNKYCFEAYLSIEHGIFQDDKDKDSSIRAVTLEHFTNTFIQFGLQVTKYKRKI